MDGPNDTSARQVMSKTAQTIPSQPSVVWVILSALRDHSNDATPAAAYSSCSPVPKPAITRPPLALSGPAGGSVQNYPA